LVRFFSGQRAAFKLARFQFQNRRLRDGELFRLSDLDWSFVDLTSAMIAVGSDPTAKDDFILANRFTYVGGNGADILLSNATTDSGVPVTLARNDRLAGSTCNHTFQFTQFGTETPATDVGSDLIRDFVVGEDQLELGAENTWAITSTGTQTLVLADGLGGTITLRGIETGALTIADLI
jgi:hypothetical protein